MHASKSIWILGCVALLLLLYITCSGSIVDAISLSRINSLIYPKDENTPEIIEIFLNERRIIFHKRTPSYDRLIHILHNSRTQKTFSLAGPQPRFPGPHTLCGLITIHGVLFSSYFRIYHSDENRNYFWIEIPKNNLNGTRFPIFAFNSDLDDLIRSTDSKTARKRSRLSMY